MSIIKKLLGLLGLLVCISTFAAEGQRKEAVLEGKYLKIVASAPDFAEDGTDSLNKPGVGKGSNDTLTEWFVHFFAPMAERTGAFYTVRMSEALNGKSVPDAKWHAEYLLKKSGLEMAQAKQIQSPSVPWADATVVAYRAEGVAFNNTKTGKEVVYVIAVSFPGNKFAYAMSGTYITPIAAFDADPSGIDKMARNALGNLWKNSTVTRK
jgi:hypothetical protein